MRKKFKRIFQPVEVKVRKMLGIKKRVKGEIFTRFGEVKDGFCKSTRFVLGLPVFVKTKTLTNALNLGTANGGGNCLVRK